ncbi:hypothetical protein BJ165DRAFT_1464164 [Panaeolus papilionaceus]|nr:hypothetical protein BJ165DRAFT_1464164 [Panaeolus papilionaceus]
MRKRRHNVLPEAEGEVELPTPVSQIGPVLSSLNTSLGVAIRDGMLSELAQQELGDELSNMLRKLQKVETRDASVSVAPDSNDQRAPKSQPSPGVSNAVAAGKIAVFGAQVTFMNTVHNHGDDSNINSELTKHHEQLQRVVRMQYIQTAVLFG